MPEDDLIRYELWKEPEGYSFFPESNEAARALLSPNSLLVWSCFARSWEDAQSKKNAHLNW